MNWLNIECSDLDSEEFLGSEPVDRSTWLCLMRFCAGQENGGRIVGCRHWGDRKWQQLIRITKKEVARKSSLWRWDGDDLVVWKYPVEKEAEVKANRINGGKGGRPRKTQMKPSGYVSNNHPVNPDETTRFKIAETERKGIGKEGNGREESESAREAPIDFGRQASVIVEAYPRREKVAEALPIVRGHLDAGESFEAMLAGTRACAAVIRTLPSGASNRYVPSALAFFRDKRWQDDPETMRRQGDAKSGQAAGNVSMGGRPAVPTTRI